MEQNKDVVFRRIKGRIVPIRLNKNRPAAARAKRAKDNFDKEVAAGFTASALGLGFIGGRAQSLFRAQGRKLRIDAYRAQGLAQRAEGVLGRSKKAKALREASKRLRSRAKVATKFGVKSRFAALTAASALLSVGGERLLPEDKTAGSAEKGFKELAVNLGSIGAVGAFAIGRKRGIKAIKKAAKDQQLFRDIKF